MSKPFGKLFNYDDSWSGKVAAAQVSPTLEVVCPVCGFNYVHIGTPGPLLGWESAADRDKLDKPHAGWVGRGGGVAIPMEGECGHNFTLCFGFDKGTLSLFATRQADRTDDEQP